MRRAGILAVVLASSAAHANMASPWQEGELVAEPFGPLREIAILRETLALDLRPLALGGPAQVTAVYHVENAGPERSTTLVFVSPRVSGQGAVRLDGAAVESRPLDALAIGRLPLAWRWPAGQGGAREHSPPSGFAFDVTLAPGKHTIAVAYAARAAAAHPHHEVYREHVVDYLLAPARAWGGFGRLEVAVTLPPGWRAQSTPALTRRGDVLERSFDGVPADQLSLVVRRPDPPALLAAVPVAGAALALGCVGLLAWVIGRKTRRLGGGADFVIAVSVTIVGGGLAAALTGIAGFGALAVLDATQLSRSWSYGHAGELLLLVLAAGVLGLVSGGVLYKLARRRP